MLSKQGVVFPSFFFFKQRLGGHLPFLTSAKYIYFFHQRHKNWGHIKTSIKEHTGQCGVVNKPPGISAPRSHLKGANTLEFVVLRSQCKRKLQKLMRPSSSCFINYLKATVLKLRLQTNPDEYTVL
jgi:hypothetical protein